MDSPYTVDWLKQNHTQLHAFGLGFLQLKLNDIERLHFWHPGFRREREEVHDHRYDFVSTILVGSMKQELFIFQEDWCGDHELFQANCAPGDVGQFKSIATGRLHRTFSTWLAKGSVYHITHDTLHSIEVPESVRCVTHLQRLWRTKEDLASQHPLMKTHSRVVRKQGTLSSCPFSESVPKYQMWEMIEDCLK